MKTQFKSWAGMLLGNLLTMSYSIVNAAMTTRFIYANTTLM